MNDRTRLACSGVTPIRCENQDVVLLETRIEGRPHGRPALSLNQRLQVMPIDQPNAWLPLVLRGPADGIQNELAGVGELETALAEVTIVRESHNATLAEASGGDHGDLAVSVGLADHDRARRGSEHDQRTG